MQLCEHLFDDRANLVFIHQFGRKFAVDLHAQLGFLNGLHAIRRRSVDRLLRLLDFTEDDGVLLFLRQIRALIDLLALERRKQQTQRVLAFLVFVLHGLHHGGAQQLRHGHAVVFGAGTQLRVRIAQNRVGRALAGLHARLVECVDVQQFAFVSSRHL